MKPHELCAFLRDAASTAFDAYREQMGQWYGPDAVTPTRESREMVRLLSVSAETLQSALWQARSMFGLDAFPPEPWDKLFSAPSDRCVCGRPIVPMIGGGWICRNPVHKQEMEKVLKGRR